VHERPADLSDADLAAAVRQYWRLEVAEIRYAAVGYGGYHWTVLDAPGRRWFATASPLTGAEDVADDLRATMRAARALADAGLDFVVAPVPASGGDVLIQGPSGYGISLFPFADGVPGQWGETIGARDRMAVTELLAALHTARPPACGVPVRGLRPRSRDYLDDSLRERGRPWRGGPYAEAARALLSKYAAGLAAALDHFDDLASQVGAADAALVVTHGEPHPGNLIRRGANYLLIDWDTVGLAPPERDLWWVLSDSDSDSGSGSGSGLGLGLGAEAARYAELTGHQLSQPAMALYRLRWDLDDVGLLLADFRAPHRRNEDTEGGWAALDAAVQRLASPEKFS
jgi:spectinomycin phosphotransferase